MLIYRMNSRATCVGLLSLIATLALLSCTTSNNVADMENDLAAAGFVARPADTPKRQAMLNLLPPNRFLQRARGNTVSYVFAEPASCHCLHIGSQKSYDLYRRERTHEKIADRELLAAQTYSDATWDWSGWGPSVANFDIPLGSGVGW